MKRFGPADGPELVANGFRMIKKSNPVYMAKLDEEFIVETDEGELKGKAGDYVAHDPISGHVWPVAASYVEQHYNDAPLEERKDS